MAREGRYRNVAVPLGEYALLKECAQKQNRSITRQAAEVIKQYHFDLFPEQYAPVRDVEKQMS